MARRMSRYMWVSLGCSAIAAALAPLARALAMFRWRDLEGLDAVAVGSPEIASCCWRRPLLVVAHGSAALAPITATLCCRMISRAGRFSGEGGLFYKDNAEQRAGRVAFDEAGNVPRAARADAVAAALLQARRSGLQRAGRGLGNGRRCWRPMTGRLVRLRDASWTIRCRRMTGATSWRSGSARSSPAPMATIRRSWRCGCSSGKLGVTVETDRVESYRIGSSERPQGLPAGRGARAGPADRRARPAPGGDRDGQRRRRIIRTISTPARPAIRVTRHADLPTAQTGWIDFVFRSSPGPRGDGHIEILADGVHVATVTGHIGHAGAGARPQPVFQVRALPRARAAGRWSVSYDDFRRGPRCADVIRAGQCPQE